MPRLLSCNLYLGRADGAALERLVRERGIDLVCAQELSAALAARLGRWLGHGDLQPDNGMRGNGIAARYPVTTRRIAMPQRSACVARLEPGDWPGLAAPLEIVNLHLAAPHFWPWFPRRLRRAAQVAALLDDRTGADALPHALVGDFNATPAWPAYRRMAAGYEDAARVVNGRAGPTWPSLPRLGVAGLFRIDHCLVRGLRVESFETVTLHGSDHRGLLVDLSPA